VGDQLLNPPLSETEFNPPGLEQVATEGLAALGRGLERGLTVTVDGGSEDSSTSGNHASDPAPLTGVAFSNPLGDALAALRLDLVGEGRRLVGDHRLAFFEDERHSVEEGHSHDGDTDEFHLDVLPGAIETTTPASGSNLPAAGAPFTLAETFQLNSNPDANHTIYLDFDGHTTTDSWWTRFNNNTAIVTPAYDFDGNVSSFSTSELERIQYIWQRVVEDFSPFNVNVTTADPGLDALSRSGSGDQTWGVRVVIGSGSWYGNAGGVGYVSSFSANIDRPVFVFENNLGNGNEKFSAEAISHEVGHSLGLNHDGQNSTEYYQGHGSGSTGYAPILGNGYYRELTQWSRGEYSGASNLEDDLSIITTNNGFGYRGDDHGNSNGSATELLTLGTSLSGSGIIERNTDSDVFSFTTGAGLVSLDISAFERGANLDILAELYDGSGALIASSNPFDLLDAGFDLSLDAGQYYLQVSGTGKGDPLNGGYSDYGSLGQYTIQGTVPVADFDTLNLVATAADQSEGNSGSRAFTFTVNRSGNLSEATSVQYAVTGSGANAATGNDFVNGVLPGGTLTFAANESTKVITVNVNGDTDIETDETFTVTLLNPAGTTVLGTASAIATIRNDDLPPTPPTVAIGPATVSRSEGNSGTTAYTFTVSLDQASHQTVTVNYRTHDGSATTADNDYVDNDGVLTFNPGELTQTVTVLVNGDTSVEGNETFTVSLNEATNAVLGTATATGTIVNDDAAPSLAISDVSVSENAGVASFTVSRSGNTSESLTVNYSTADGNGKNGAKVGTDFVGRSGTLTFAAGVLSQTIEVGILDDATQEANESFFVNLSNATNGAILSDATGIGTILNDDSGSGGGGRKGGKAPAAADDLLGYEPGASQVGGNVDELTSDQSLLSGGAESSLNVLNGVGDRPSLAWEEVIERYGVGSDRFNALTAAWPDWFAGPEAIGPLGVAGEVALESQLMG
jgi:hypothetical protein